MNEYDYYPFDWNEMSDKYSDNFNVWLRKYQNDRFRLNYDDLILKIEEDIDTITKEKLAKEKLDNFEELISGSLGSEVMMSALSKYEEMVIMDPNATSDSIKKGFEESKNIIDEDGNINQDKIDGARYLVDVGINLPNFERFVEKNPDFQGVFDDWKKLFDEHTELMVKDLNIFRSSTSLERLVELRDFLTQL